MKTCPNCGSTEIYRQDLQSLTIHCGSEALLQAERCGHQWEAEQVRKPLATARAREKRYPRTRLNIGVYLCPIDRDKYSFAINNGNGIIAFNEFETDRYLSGCYHSIEEALTAGINFSSAFTECNRCQQDGRSIKNRKESVKIRSKFTEI
ncbi:MAG: hypothetical protein GPJ25_10215 [Microcystis aeruginosa LE13-04]|nr:hypothetical protein [Microcystis aeruginosa LE13-04]